MSKHHARPMSAAGVATLKASGCYFQGLALVALFGIPAAVFLIWLRLYPWLWAVWGLCLIRVHFVAKRYRASFPAEEEEEEATH